MKNSLILSIFLIFSLSPQNTIADDYQKWNLPEGAKLRIGKGSVKDIMFSPDGERLIAVCSIGIWIYDTQTGAALDLVSYNASKLISVSPDASLYVSQDSDGTVNVRNMSDRRIISTLQGDNLDIDYMRFNLEKNILVSDIGSEIHVWDISTGELKTAIDLEADWIYDVIVSPDGTKLASTSRNSDDYAFQLWDVATGSHITTFARYVSRGELVFTPDSRTIISGDENSIQLWDVATGKRTLNFRTPRFHKIAVSPDGDKLATSGQGGLHFWDIKTGEYIDEFGEHYWGAFSFSPDGRTLASSQSSQLYLWDVASGVRKLSIPGHTSGVVSMALSPNGKLLASSNSHNIYLWDPITGKFDQMIYGRGRFSSHTNLVFNPDGNILASLDFGAIHLWDISSKTQIHTIYKWYGHGEEGISSFSRPYSSIAFSPDGQYIASGHTDNSIHLWYMGRTYVDALKGHTDDVTSIAFFRDNRTLVSGSYDGTVRLWDFNSRSNIETFTGHTNKVNYVALSPDERTIASGSEDNMIVLWDVATGNSRVIHTPHIEGVHDLTFSKDSRTLVSTGHWRDNTAYIWDVDTGELNRTITNHYTSAVGDVVFSHDGKTLITGNRDGTILFWDYSSLMGTDIETQKLAEDVNRDGIVNLQDLIFVASQFGQDGYGNTADINRDGVINIADILLVAAALPSENAAPSIYAVSDKLLHVAEVEHWLNQARYVDADIPKFLKGITVLEQLLAALTPEKTTLLANYPNPFNPETWIPYQLAERADVTLHIYSSDGQLVRTLALGKQPAGIYQNRSHAAYWDGKNEQGEPVASGTYFYTLTAGNFTATRRMVIRK